MKKLIKTEGTEFEQNYKDLALIETDDRAGIPTMISSEDFNEGYSNADSETKALIDAGGSTINNQDKTITSNGEYTADTGYTGLGTVNVTVEPVLETIDYSVTGNNTYTITKTDPTKDGIGQVNLTVDVPQTVTPVDLDLSTGVKFARSMFNQVPQEIVDANWDDITNAELMFENCTSLYEVPNIDTSHLTSVNSMFDNCFNLTTFNVLNLSSVEFFTNIFAGMQSIEQIVEDTPWENILKTLKTINISNLNASQKPYLTNAGFNGTQIARLTGLSGWSALEALGWSTGLELTVQEDLTQLKTDAIGLDHEYASSVPNAYVCYATNRNSNLRYELTLEDTTLGESMKFIKDYNTTYRNEFISENGEYYFNGINPYWSETDQCYYGHLYNLYRNYIYNYFRNPVYDSGTDTTTFDYSIELGSGIPVYLNTITVIDDNDPNNSIIIAINSWLNNNTSPITGSATISGNVGSATFVYDATMPQQI